MDDDRQYLVPVLILESLLAGAHRTFYYRTNDFQVGWIEAQGHMNNAPRALHVAGKSLVILDVA